MTQYHDRMSGERFEAASDAAAVEYLAEALCPGEIVSYELECSDGRVLRGEVAS